MSLSDLSIPGIKAELSDVTNNNRPEIISKPTNFDCTILLTIIKEKFGNFFTTFNPKTLLSWLLNPKKYYVNISTGLDTNDGLTTATPFKTVKKALTMSDVDEIWVAGGVYSRADAFNNGTALPDRDVKIIGMDGNTVILGAHEAFSALTWTVNSGTVYQATRANTLDVVDMSSVDDYGDYKIYTKKTSLADVQAIAGTWYTDGTIVYVRCFDDRTPDANIALSLQVDNCFINKARKYYFKNLKFYFGKTNIFPQKTTAGMITVVAEDCEFKYAGLTNATQIEGNVEFYATNCVAAHAFLDGFNYHISGAYNPKFFENNCIGRHNGLRDTTHNLNNGSTAHDNIRGIRLNGKYFNNKGGNVHDVNTSKTWNINCFVQNSQSDDPAYNYDFRTGDSATQYLDYCTAYGTSLANIKVDTGCSTYVRHCDYDRVDGTVTSY